LKIESHGAAAVADRKETAAKWANTSDTLQKIDIKNGEADSYDSTSEAVVLSFDEADTHTDNFWEQLANVTAGGSSTNLSSGTITAKKFLRFMAFLEPASTSVSNMTFNNDTTTYSYRENTDGTEGTSASDSHIELFTTLATPMFVDGYIINLSAQEKICIGHTISQGTAGAGTAPLSREFVGKYDSTSAQVTEIDIDPHLGHAHLTNFIYRQQSSQNLKVTLSWNFI